MISVIKMKDSRKDINKKMQEAMNKANEILVDTYRKSGRLTWQEANKRHAEADKYLKIYKQLAEKELKEAIKRWEKGDGFV